MNVYKSVFLSKSNVQTMIAFLTAQNMQLLYAKG